MRGKPDVGNFPACSSPGLVTPGLSRRHAYRRAYVASPRLTTTDVGLTPRLAYARVVHTAPVAELVVGLLSVFECYTTMFILTFMFLNTTYMLS